jgi:hypothetical protein
MESNLGIVALGAALAGVVLHHIWFKRSEQLFYAPQYVLLLMWGPAIVATTLWYKFEFSAVRAVLVAVVGYVSFLASLYSSIAIYRLYFHPLRQFPGPPWARLTQFAHVRNVAAKCNGFKYLDQLHAEYGDYVRIGPNLLSIADPDWVEPIHNAQSKWEKADWYSQGHPMTTLHQMRDKNMHDARRRHGWDKAFTTKSLRAYDSRLLKYSDGLVNQIRKRSGKPVNATSWTNFFAFDVMGQPPFLFRRLWLMS